MYSVTTDLEASPCSLIDLVHEPIYDCPRVRFVTVPLDGTSATLGNVGAG